MSPTTAGKTPLDALRSFERTTAQGLGSLWGMTLEHLSEKQAKAAAAWTPDPKGDVARTPDGVVVTTKALMMQDLLNNDRHYTIETYQYHVNQDIRLLYLGIDSCPE